MFIILLGFPRSNWVGWLLFTRWYQCWPGFWWLIGSYLVWVGFVGTWKRFYCFFFKSDIVALIWALRLCWLRSDRDPKCLNLCANAQSEPFLEVAETSPNSKKNENKSGVKKKKNLRKKKKPSWASVDTFLLAEGRRLFFFHPFRPSSASQGQSAFDRHIGAHKNPVQTK